MAMNNEGASHHDPQRPCHSQGVRGSQEGGQGQKIILAVPWSKTPSWASNAIRQGNLI